MLDEVPSCPEQLRYLIQYYFEVADGEGLNHQKIHYWSLVSKRDVAAWEADVLLRIDQAYWAAKAGG